MTDSATTHRTHDPRRRSIQADLAFWTVAGAVAAAFSGSLTRWWGVPRAVLLAVGVAFAVLGPILLWGLNRMRVTRGLIAAFVVTNAVLAPVAFAGAAFGRLPLTGAGSWALADAGAVMLVLGVWQFSAMRTSRD